MKILIITPYKNHLGGVEIVNKELEIILKESGHKVDYLTIDEKPKFNLLNKIINRIIGDPYITYFKYSRLKKVYDIIISNGEFSLGINHERAINVFHGSYLGYRKYLKEVLTLREKLSMKKLSFIQRIGSKGKIIVAVSHFIANILEKQGIRVDKVIENCVDTNKFRPLKIKKKNEYIFVGRYGKNGYAKGFDILEKIAQKGYKINCITTDRYKNNYTKLNFIGIINNSLLPRIYNRHRMLIFPSRFEALSMVILEAMSCGLPVIISNVGIALKLKNEIPEFVVDDWNADSYIERINKINRNYNFFSAKARKYVLNNHSKKIFKQKWLKLLEDIR